MRKILLLFLLPFAIKSPLYAQKTADQKKAAAAFQPKIALIDIMDTKDQLNIKETAKSIVHAAKNPEIIGILLLINCYGGCCSDFSVIHDLIKKVSSMKPIVSLVSTVLSGGYLIATATDYIIAHSASDIGCIGVIDTFQGNSQKSETLTIGTYKEIGFVPPSKLSDKKREYLKKHLEKYYTLLVATIASNRSLDGTQHTSWADGKRFIGAEAVSAGLVDEIGTFFEAEKKLVRLIQERFPHIDCSKLISIEV